MAAVGSPRGEVGCRLSHRLTGDQGQSVSPRLVLLTLMENCVSSGSHTWRMAVAIRVASPGSVVSGEKEELRGVGG